MTLTLGGGGVEGWATSPDQDAAALLLDVVLVDAELDDVLEDAALDESEPDDEESELDDPDELLDPDDDRDPRASLA